MRRQDRLLHGAGQGPGFRAVLPHVQRVRRRTGGHADRRRQHQPEGADRLLHRRGAREHGAAAGRGPSRRLRGDGRVPLLRGPGARRVVAGAPDHPARHDLPPDVGDPRQHGADQRGPATRDRPPRGARQRQGSTGAARVRVPRYAAAHDDRGTRERRPGAGLCRQLHPAGLCAAGPEPDQPETLFAGGEEGDLHGDPGLPLRHGLRQGDAALPRLRHRRPPRGPAAEVPAAGREAGAVRAAQGDRRHGHAGRGRQRADPYGPLQPALQVRRREGHDPHGARLPADRRPRRPQGLRRPGLGGVSGAGARDRESPATAQGERLPARARARARARAQSGPQAIGAARLRAVGRAHLRAPDHEPARDAGIPLPAPSRHGVRPDPGRRVGPQRREPHELRLAAPADRRLPRTRRNQGPADRTVGGTRARAAPRRHSADGGAARRRLPGRGRPGTADRVLDAPEPVALSRVDPGTPRPGGSGLRAGPAQPGRGDPGGPRDRAPPPGGQVEARTRRAAQGETGAVRGTDGTAAGGHPSAPPD